MKKCTLPILGALALSLACSSVFATDGTITVNGVVTDQTCTLGPWNGAVNGLKNLTINLSAIPKSLFKPTTSLAHGHTIVMMSLNNAIGGVCDAATSQALKGIHLSAISPDHLDVEDKTLLVNQATGASSTNPVFFQFQTSTNSQAIDFSEPWGSQAKTPISYWSGIPIVTYELWYRSKTGIVDAQNVNATINYTLHYN
ncbi:fimbrial protein [Acinetobacter guillouiae]|uniref:fimbrial protein n=1 Tax=Acinetobacter guillouiae TaxID=106649 RepID=UPI001CD541B9|nr:type 1 fimbrial protein [Acinetobacter guillouiae]